MAALALSPFIESECGSSINLSPQRRTMLDAQALSYIKASVNRNVTGHLISVTTAFQAMSVLKMNFENVRATDLVALHKKFGALRFKRGFPAIRFISDFEAMIDEYKQMGTVFTDEYIASIFLEKIDGSSDPFTRYFSFLSTITALPRENQSFEYVKARFLALESGVCSTLTKRYNENKENVQFKKPKMEMQETSTSTLNVGL